MSRLKLEGRRIIVTGAAGGIGRTVCQRLALDGAKLVLVGRDRERLSQAVSEIPGQPHEVAALDVSDQRAWERTKNRIAPDGVIHGVVAAAAILGPIGPLGSWTIDDFKRTLEVNLIGTLVTLTTLLDELKSGCGSAVLFSGGGATSPFPRYDAYATSKAAVVRMAENISSDLETFGVRVNCIAPGFVASDMHLSTINAGPERVGVEYFERTQQVLNGNASDDPSLAANLTSFLLSDDSSGITGRLISAQWDPWNEPSFQQRLRNEPDLATLRRIDGQFFAPLAHKHRN